MRSSDKTNGLILTAKGGYQETKTPEHDRITAWVDANAEKIVRELQDEGEYTTWSSEHISKCKTQALASHMNRLFKDIPIPDPPDYKLIRIEGSEWEKPITKPGWNGLPTIVGYADLAVRFVEDRKIDLLTRAEWCEPIKDYLREWYWQVDWVHGKWFFEVKPTIPSISELIRQVRFYEQYTNVGSWVVVSPDATHAELLERQKIRFLQAPKAGA